MGDPEQLATLVQSLPQELYDQVFSLTFTSIPTINPIIITKSYKPPSCLQVSRDTRATFAAAYYPNNRFDFEHKYTFPDAELAGKWLASLSRSHFEHLEMVVLYDGYDDGKVADLPHTLEAANSSLARSKVKLEDCGFLYVMLDGQCYRPGRSGVPRCVRTGFKPAAKPGK